MTRPIDAVKSKSRSKPEQTKSRAKPGRLILGPTRNETDDEDQDLPIPPPSIVIKRIARGISEAGALHLRIKLQIDRSTPLYDVPVVTPDHVVAQGATISVVVQTANGIGLAGTADAAQIDDLVAHFQPTGDGIATVTIGLESIGSAEPGEVWNNVDVFGRMPVVTSTGMLKCVLEFAVDYDATPVAQNEGD